ncbi:hypothetical protein HN681_04685 [archaeon]|jgi:hypothetical protein|nr:hypothetical protein [archaeon]MBT3731004.1 hypothetical protein [archaeon]MBT4669758.1 hypothetical protein [archaeon]MBT5029908.1 hypothetical protein [archaeon]MBT5288480.1 hypothetical protein [archaeon]
MKEKIILVLFIISISLNIFFLVNSTITGQTIAEPVEKTEFNVYTEAVCEENGNIECHDEVFVDCNGVETKLGNIVGNNPEFELDWEDPRE